MEVYMEQMHVLDKNDNILFTGTKQDCMHFIKRRHFLRDQVKVQTVRSYNEAHPVDEKIITLSNPEPTGWFKRMFFRK